MPGSANIHRVLSVAERAEMDAAFGSRLLELTTATRNFAAYDRPLTDEECHRIKQAIWDLETALNITKESRAA